MGYTTALDKRLRRLEQQGARDSAHEPDTIWYQLSVSASCPPNKSVHIHSGIATPTSLWGGIINYDFIPNTVCDFENEAETQMDLVFSNAGYFLPVILCYYWEWISYAHYWPEDYGEPVFDNVIGTEVATATEAEAQIDGFLNGVEQWYNYRMPIHGVVLQNDGNVGVMKAILPIDQTNRGRSYLYRDARVRRGALA